MFKKALILNRQLPDSKTRSTNMQERMVLLVRLVKTAKLVLYFSLPKRLSEMEIYKQVPADHKGIPGTWSIRDEVFGKYMEFYCHSCGLLKQKMCLITSGLIKCECGTYELIEFEKVGKVNA